MRLRDITLGKVTSVGGKAANLSELIRIGLNVPEGFVLTVKICRDIVKDGFSEELKEKIKEFVDCVGGKVSVRSSSVMEDTDKNSFAGQYKTILNVNKKNIFKAIKECLEPQEKAIEYGKLKGLKLDCSIALIIQKMVDSKFSGVIFTINPVTKNNNEMVIEVGRGHGDKVVSGDVIPNNYVIDRKGFDITKKTESFNFNKKIIRRLAKYSLLIESHFKKSQDIEFAIDKNEKIFFLQSRPITT